MPSKKSHFPGHLGSGERFESCVRDVRRHYADKGYHIVSDRPARVGAHEANPRAVCAAIGRSAYGPQKFQKMAAAGRRHPRRNPAYFAPGEPVIFAPRDRSRLALYTVAPVVGEAGNVSDAPPNGVVYVTFPSTGTISVAYVDLWSELQAGAS